jgi:hypothetical protein
MIELETVPQHLLMLGIAAVFGGIGGIAAELLELRGEAKDTGALEIPRSLGKRYRDLGWLASVVLGAIAATAALFFLAPTEEIVRPVAGGTETTTEYELFKLVALSLIVGSAGSRFLAALQDRALATAKAERTDAAVATSQAATASLPKQSRGAGPQPGDSVGLLRGHAGCGGRPGESCSADRFARELDRRSRREVSRTGARGAGRNHPPDGRRSRRNRTRKSRI